MTQNGPRCVHCGGSLLREEGEVKCVSCSRTWRGRVELHQFYQEHRDAILETVRKLGREKAAECWQIPPGTLHKIITNWGEDETPPVPETVTTGPESNSPGSPAPAAAAPEESIILSPGIVSTWSMEIDDIDLAVLDQATFNMFWSALGEIIRSRYTREEVQT